MRFMQRSIRRGNWAGLFDPAAASVGRSHFLTGAFCFQYRGFLAGGVGVRSAMQLAMKCSLSPRPLKLICDALAQQ